MKIEKIKYLFVGLLLMSVSSCTDFLDEKLLSGIDANEYCKTELEIKTALNGAYKTVGNNYISGYNSSQLPTDLQKRPIWSLSSGLGSYTYTPSNDWFYQIWQVNYRGIRDCNYVIQSIERMANADGKYNKYLAQARGLRGYIYFNLVRYFGGVPLVDYISDSPADTGLRQPRASMNDTFQFIIDDLTYAETHGLLESEGDYAYGRFNVNAARGFLAKLYLYMGSVSVRDKVDFLDQNATHYFQCALDYSKKVIESGTYQLSPFYPDVFSVNSEDKAKQEVIFSIVHNDDKDTGGGVGMMYGIPGKQEYGASFGMVASTNFHAMFYEQSDSVRRKWNCPRVNITESKDDSGKLIGVLSGYDYRKYMSNPADDILGLSNAGVVFNFGKFRRFPLKNPAAYSRDAFGMDEPVLRFADILLIYAEAFNEVNGGPGNYNPSTNLNLDGSNIESAYDAVNLIRKRARVAINGIIHEDVVPRIYNYEHMEKNEPTIETYPLEDENGDPILDEDGNPTYDRHIISKGCVPDWKPGFYGYYPSSQQAGLIVETEVWEVNAYSDDYRAFRIEILNERVRELVGEVNDRWFDLSRRNELVNAIEKCSNTKNPLLGNFLNTEKSRWSYFSPDAVKEHMVRLPIPTQEIDSNPMLVQNPGY